MSTTEIYTLSLHDALPICGPCRARTMARHPLGQPVSGHHQRDKDRKSTRLNSSHVAISYAVFCLKKKIFLIIKSAVNHTTRRRLNTITLPSIKLTNISSKI